MLEVLSNAVDELLTVDMRELSDSELHDVAVTTQTEIDRFNALQARALQRWDARKV